MPTLPNEPRSFWPSKRLHDEWLETPISYKVDWERELERPAACGASGPEPLPHPDDIRIDMNTGVVRITGPMQKHEKPLWDELKEKKTMFEAELAELRQELEDASEHEHRKIIEDEIALVEKILEIFRLALPD